MKIKFIKDQKDIRKNRSKVIKKGTELSCLQELGEKYVKMGVAKELKVALEKPILSVKQIEKLKQ